MANPPGFTDLRATHQQQIYARTQQQEATTKQAAEIISLFTSIVQAPGYKHWKDALLKSAEAKHQEALTAATPHAMAMALGAEGAYRAAAHLAEDIVTSNQNTIQSMR